MLLEILDFAAHDYPLYAWSFRHSREEAGVLQYQVY